MEAHEETVDQATHQILKLRKTKSSHQFRPPFSVLFGDLFSWNDDGRIMLLRLFPAVCSFFFISKRSNQSFIMGRERIQQNYQRKGMDKA
jgi:hypothetical protein